MAWVNPTNRTTGDVITAAQWNDLLGAVGDLAQLKTSVALTVIDDFTVTGSVLASYDTNTRLGGSIPQTYKDLVIAVSGRGDTAATNTLLFMTLNNDTAANYQRQAAATNGSTVTNLVNGIGNNQGWAGLLNAATGGPTASPGLSEIVLPNYTGTTFNKSWYAAGFLRDATGATGLKTFDGGSEWSSTAAVTRLALFPGSGNFVIGTRFTLYGRG